MKPLTIATVSFFALVPVAAAQWIPVSDPGTAQGIELLLAGGDRLYAGSSTGKVFATTDHGSSWSEIAGGLVETYAPVQGMAREGDWFLMSRFGVGGTDSNFRSHFDGATWSPWQPIAYQDDVMRSFVVSGSSVFAVRVDGRIWRTDDHFATWATVPTPSTNGIAMIFTHDGRLFASENIVNGGVVYRSGDLGATWTVVSAGLGSSYICSSVVWNGTLLMCTYHSGGVGKLWSSATYGDAWTQVLTLPTTYNLNGAALLHDGRLVVGASSGVPDDQSIWTTDDLVTWQDYTGDLPAAALPVNDLLAHDGWLFKSGGTVQRYRAPDPSATAAPLGVPDSAALTASPNPFRPETTFRFALPRAGEAELALFDVAGRRVATIAHGAMPAGPRTIPWTARDDDGRTLSPGVYLARLHADGVVRTVKLLLRP